MKKSITLVAMSIIYCMGVNAQENKTPASDKDTRTSLHAGAKAGLNYSGTSEANMDTGGKLGFAGGVFFQIPIGEYLGIHPELLISQKGFTGEGQFLGNTYEMKRTTTHLDIPLLVAFKPVEYFTVVGGPQYSYLLNKKDVFRDGNITTIQEREFANDNIRRNVLSAALGLDVNVSRFVISGRYCFDLQQNTGDGSSTTPRYKNNWIQGTVGIRF